METIKLTSNDGEELELYILEETKLNGNTYILTAENEDGDGDAYILKQVGEDGEDVIYEGIEDETEYDAVAKVFMELMDDVEFE